MRRSSLPALLVIVFCALGPSYAQVYCPQLGQQSQSNSSYAIDKNGKLWAWGANESGELGIGNLTDQSIPVQVALPSGAGGWVRIAAGENFAIGVTDSDRLYAWGNNTAGQLGLGNVTDQKSPARIANPSGVTAWRAISAGKDHAVALSSTGVLYAWGDNGRGQLGTETDLSQKSPHLVPFPAGVHAWTAVAAGSGFTVAISDVGELYAWGYDSSGVWGTIGVNPPAKISTQRFAGTGWLPSIGAGNRSLVAIFTYGNSYTPGLTSSASYTIAVAAGVSHQMFLDWGGRLTARGDNEYGQLGVTDPFATSSTVPFPAGVTKWVALAAGKRHSLALGNDGNLYAWGDNDHGQLGIGTNDAAMEPFLVRSFCDPAKGTVALNSSDTRKMSFTFDAVLRDTAQATLVGPMAYLSAPFPVILFARPLQSMNPFTLMTGDTASAHWDGTVDSSINFSAGVLGYAYVYTIGSAPIISAKVISLNVHRAPQPVRVSIVDSLTNTALANVEVTVPNVDTLVTNANGTFTFTNKQEQVTLLLDRENYRSKSVTLTMPPSPDSVSFTIPMTPSPVVGRAVKTGRDFEVRVVAADTATLYGIAGRNISASFDGGSTWQSVLTATDTLRDLAFVTSDLGFAVGDNGVIIRIDRKNINYTVVHPFPVAVRLNAVCTANHAVWIVGDSGTVIRLSPSGIWTRESIPGTSLICVTSLDTSHAVAVARSGRLYDRVESRGWVPMTTGSDATRAYLVEPDLLYYISPDGSLYYTYLSDPSQSGKYVSWFGFRTKPASNGGLYFLNRSFGFAVGEDTIVAGATDTSYRAPRSSGILVTYDGGVHWARVASMTPWNQATAGISIDAIGLQAFATVHHDSLYYTHALWSYPITAGPLSAVLTGRFIDRDGLTGIAGATVVLHGADGNDYFTYSTEKGYYVLTDVPVSADNQTVDLRFADSSGIWSYSAPVTLSAGQVTRVDFAHPLTNMSVEAQSEQSTAESLSVRWLAGSAAGALSQSKLRFELSGLNESHPAFDAQLFDVLGRPIQSLMSHVNRSSLGSTVFEMQASELTSGMYFCIIRTDDGRQTSCRVLIP